MRLASLLAGVLAAASALLSVSASTEPELQVVGFFPEDNPFGHVVNGEKNGIFLNVTNVSSRNVTLLNIRGSFHDPDTHTLVKNTSAVNYGLPLPSGSRIQLPYAFYSEFKPGDLRLNLFLEHKSDDETYRVIVYDSIVTIVEPEASLFDYKLILTYLIIAAMFCALAYFAFVSFVPQPKKSKPKKAPAPDPATNTADPNATATGANAYQEEWIPALHLKKAKAGKKKSGVIISGDDQSGQETSGTEVKVRKGRK